MSVLTVTRGEGRYAVTARAERCGGDLLLLITGGEAPHVGAAALAQYEPERRSATVSSLCAYGHRDDSVAARFAKEAARAGKCSAAAAAGIHVDDAGPEDLKLLRENCERCLEALLERMDEI